MTSMISMEIIEGKGKTPGTSTEGFSLLGGVSLELSKSGDQQFRPT
jgi:hypothetical protein